MIMTCSNFRDLNEGPLYSVRLQILFLQILFVSSPFGLCTCIVFYSFFYIIFLECLNNGHNLLPGKYSSVHFLMYRQFNMKTAMKSTNISGRTPLVPFCLRLISISLQPPSSF